MDNAEMIAFAEKHMDVIEIKDDMNGQLLFRDTRLMWYKNDPNRYTGITYQKVRESSAEAILEAISDGLKVDGITRVTGYMAKTSQWNPGKQAELKERRRMDLQGNAPSHASACPIKQVA